MYRNENVPFKLLTRLHKEMVWCKYLNNIPNPILSSMLQLEFLENQEKIMIKLYYFLYLVLIQLPFQVFSAESLSHDRVAIYVCTYQLHAKHEPFIKPWSQGKSLANAGYTREILTCVLAYLRTHAREFAT